jgi:hypothetical protein
MSTTRRPAAPSEMYLAIAARRTQFDNLLWQVPVLSLTAQAFLFTVALGADTSRTARIIAAFLSLIVTFLTLQLFTRHRQAEITDAHWLERYEMETLGVPPAHGIAWRQVRNDTHPAAGVFSPLARLKGFRTWLFGLSLFGLASLLILSLSIGWPNVLHK